MYSVLLGLVGLGIALLVALWLTFARKLSYPDPSAPRRLIIWTVSTLVLQSLHFIEEWYTGFYTAYPVLLGLEPWSVTFFIGFNVAWLGIWIGAIWGLHAQWQIALWPIWFLGIGCIMNGVAHPVFAVMAGDYFPGLWSAPFVGLLGFLLLRSLKTCTRTVP